ncbi:uncharacterized protein EI90DRAFT_2295010 [Cantharellus anzutake]|uniref:uncharacterized protein n=1 Tax=Cantharellus anzutake TaxID=1750568 RepID=UPI0019039A9C|nr:uncharacterized protein EI90DRAFT_2295010 [Cantharellus anzutake]KAF8339860.1 hypothetical protein EI90DRAFT_2295010 [Cantharellus anzutake]
MPGNHAYASLMCTVLGSIFEVFFMCFMGWMLSRKHVLDKTTVKKVNLINLEGALDYPSLVCHCLYRVRGGFVVHGHYPWAHEVAAQFLRGSSNV